MEQNRAETPQEVRLSDTEARLRAAIEKALQARLRAVRAYTKKTA